MVEGAADKAESLAGCKSPYRQLPVFGRLAYPMRGEATNRVLLGRKSPGCPAAVFAAVGTIWGASKLGGRNITKYLQPRNATPREIVIRGQTREADPTLDLGKADGAVEETGASTRSTAGVWGPASKERFSVDNVGKLPWAAGTGYNLQGLSKRGQKPKEERAQRERRMSQYEQRRRSNVLSGDGSRLPNGGNTRVGQSGSGHLAAFSVCLGGRLDKTGTHANDGSRGEVVGKPGVVGVYTNQRFNLSKLWEGSRRTCQGLKPVSGNPTDRHFRGASRTVRHGETVNPPAIERAGPETPHLQRGALDLYPNML